MKIEDQIKSKGFQDEWHKATVNILYSHNWLTKILESRANQWNITLQQYNVLRILRGQYPNPVSNRLIKDRMITDTPDISRLVERIVNKGMVERTKSNIDKRSVDLIITQKGLQLLEDLDKEMMITDILAQNLTEKEAKSLNSLLDKLRGK